MDDLPISRGRREAHLQGQDRRPRGSIRGRTFSRQNDSAAESQDLLCDGDWRFETLRGKTQEVVP